MSPDPSPVFCRGFFRVLPPLVVAATFQVQVETTSAAGAYQPWSDSTYLYLDTSPAGINLTTQALAYPLLVRLRAPEFPFNRARGQGQDLRFSNSSGTPLPYEIETWDSAGGRADVWVLVDTVKASSATHHLNMYWGNSAAASESNSGAVFTAANGMHSVWHMGAAGTGARPNAVTGGNPATPVNYDGDESRPGIIGRCDSLDGGSPGDHLDAGDGYANWSSGFTYSAWVRPTAVKLWARLMDFGNGPEASNIILGRDGTSDNFAVHVFSGTPGVSSRHATPAFFTLNQWQHVTVAIRPSDSAVFVIRNGALIWNGKLGIPLANVARTMNWLGRSNWSADAYWQGQFDEVRLDRVFRGPEWNTLNYQSQREGSTFVTFRAPAPPVQCQERFAVPADTAVAEGAILDLAGTADCATTYNWSVASGLSIRILDPSSKSLAFSAPRVAGDTQVTFRFEAVMPGSTPSGQVRVSILEAIPEPRFTLPDSLAWGAPDSLVLSPAFSNLAAVKASRDSILTFAWTLSGQEADTVWRGLSLVVRKPAVSGVTTVKLCVDNRGPASCASTRLVTPGPVGVAAPLRTPRKPLVKPFATSAADEGLPRLDGRLVPRRLVPVPESR